MKKARTTALPAGLVLGLVLGACAADTSPEAAPATELARTMKAYGTDAGARRSALEASLVNPDNAYSRLRLGRYNEQTWGALPVFDPPTTAMTPADVATRPEVDATWTSLDSDATAWDESALRELGERAFYNYPMQLAPGLESGAALSDSAGIWTDGGRLGAVWVSLPAGVSAAVTCATCHASKDEHGLVAGRNNPNVDAARIYGVSPSAASWPRGTVDVTDDGIDNPVAIADLRPVRMQRNLHHAASIRNSPAALAVRIETLIVTSLGQSARPPRKVAAALAVYLTSLPLRALPVAGAAESEGGRAVFARECAGCHRGDEMSGPPVALAVVGTNPSVGESPDRGTGSYRVPSLRGVGDRHRLLATGEVEDVTELLAPDRKAQGHRYGLGLDPSDRAALLRYLHAL